MSGFRQPVPPGMRPKPQSLIRLTAAPELLETSPNLGIEPVRDLHPATFLMPRRRRQLARVIQHDFTAICASGRLVDFVASLQKTDN